VVVPVAVPLVVVGIPVPDPFVGLTAVGDADPLPLVGLTDVGDADPLIAVKAPSLGALTAVGVPVAESKDNVTVTVVMEQTVVVD
jgi:hypothetical protein